MPDKQDDERADDGADQARALIGPIPADRLTDEGGDESVGNAEQRRENKTGWIVWSGRQQARDDAGDETDDDHPDKVHSEPREDSHRNRFSAECSRKSGHQRHNAPRGSGMRTVRIG